jgi:hypothetical protein
VQRACGEADYDANEPLSLGLVVVEEEDDKEARVNL